MWKWQYIGKALVFRRYVLDYLGVKFPDSSREREERESTNVKYSLHYSFSFSVGLTFFKIKVKERCVLPAESVSSKLPLFCLSFNKSSLDGR